MKRLSTKKDCTQNKRNLLNDNKGFMLAEASMAVAIMAILGATLVPKLTEKYDLRLIEKTAAEMHAIQTAAKNYRVATGSWPADIATMKTLGYLPAAWSATTPWGFAYTGTPSGSTFNVTAQMPTKYKDSLRSFLPQVAVSGDLTTSSVPVPGAEPGLGGVLSGADTFTGDITIDKTTPALNLKDEASGLLYRVVNGAGHLKFLNNASTAAVDIDQAGKVTALSDVVSGGNVYAKRFIDADNNSFFVDPNGTSSLSVAVVGTINGSTAASGTLTINGTSDPTSGNILLNTTGGKVGIGTSTPAYTLDVNGQIRTSGGIVFSDGTSMTTAVTGYWTKNGNDITNNNSGNVYIAGSLAVGQSTAPAEKLDVNGNINLGATDSVLKMRGVPVLQATGSHNIFVGNAGNFTLAATDSTGVGNGALAVLASGSGVTAVGSGAGSALKSGNSVTLIGSGSSASDGLSFATAIGAGSSVTQSNTIVLGRASDSVAIGATSPGAGNKLLVRGNGTSSSAFALATQNGSGATLFSIRTDGAIQVSNGVGLAGQSLLSAGGGAVYWGPATWNADSRGNLFAGNGAFGVLGNNATTVDNVAIGTNAMGAVTGNAGTVSGNVAIGPGALYNSGNVDGAFVDVVAIGRNAGAAFSALKATASGSIFIGLNADGTSGNFPVVAIGPGASAEGKTDSDVALGINAKAAGGALAVGNVATALNGGIAIGGSATTNSSKGSIVIGNSSSATAVSDGAIVVGYSCSASGVNSIAVGWAATTTGPNSVSVGISAAAADSAVAFGRNASTADHGVALGGSAVAATYATAIGYGATANYSHGIAIGSGVVNIGTDSVVIGRSQDNVGIGVDPGPNYKFLVRANDSTSSKYTIVAQNSLGNNLFSVRNDSVVAFSGNVAIGFTDPGSTRLFLRGADSLATSNALNVQNSSANNLLTIKNDGSVTVTYGVTATSVTATTFTSSDVRLKKNFERIHTPLQKLLSITGYTYEYRTEEFADRNLLRGRQIGFAAQDLEEVLPELVGTGADGYKFVNYAGMVPVLVEAIKELSSKISQVPVVITDVTRRDGVNTYSFRDKNTLAKLFSVSDAKVADREVTGYVSAKDVYIADKGKWASEVGAPQFIDPVKIYDGGVTTGFTKVDLSKMLPGTAKVAILDIVYSGTCSLTAKGSDGRSLSFNRGQGVGMIHPDRILEFLVEGDDDCREQISITGYY